MKTPCTTGRYIRKSGSRDAYEILCTLDEDFFDPATQKYLARFGVRVMGDVDLIRELRETH